MDLEPTHYDMKLTDKEFDAAGNVLANMLDVFNVLKKDEVISGTIK